VEAVAGTAVRAGSVIDKLGSLVDSSLVQSQAGDGERRFRMLGTVRDYALGRLRDNDADWRQAHDLHAAHYAALAEPAEAELQGLGQLTWLRRLETEHANLAAAMSWLTSQDRPDMTLRLAWKTWRFWWLQGHADELARFGRTVVAKSAPFAPHQRALALAFGAFESLAAGNNDRAQGLFEQSMPLFRETGDKLRVALTASVLGHLLALQQREADANAMLDQSQALIKELDADELSGADRVQKLANTALTYNFLGQIRLSQGDRRAAAGLFTQALSAAHQVQDRFTLLISLCDLALARHALGDLSGAAAHLAEGLSLAAEADDQTSTAHYLEAMAVLATPNDDPQRAVHLLAAAAELAEDNGSGWLLAFLPSDTRGDEARSALRSRLGGQAFEAAWAYGRSMGAKRAVEYALNQPGAI
jgi:tetratricopeptide (TPR) repeat protein